MNGELSQLVSLATAANGMVAGQLDPASFYPDNSAFKFCNAVTFVDLKRGLLGNHREVERCASPIEWLNDLRRISGRSVWLDYTATDQPDAPDHKLAAFVGGGGDWSLVLSGSDVTERWMARWDVTDIDATDQRIWRVTYGCVQRSPGTTQTPVVELEATTGRLRSVLQEIHTFASSQSLDQWARYFQQSLDALDIHKQPTFPDYIEFVCLGSYPEQAQRLFAAAYKGWVFGGMGSWNDMYFEHESDNTVHEKLSADLYSAINKAIQVASCTFGV